MASESHKIARIGVLKPHLMLGTRLYRGRRERSSWDASYTLDTRSSLTGVNSKYRAGK